MYQKHRKRNRRAFTLLELLLACGLLCVVIWSGCELYGVYRRLMLFAAVDQVALTCQYLARCASLKKKKTSFTIRPPSGYCIDDGDEKVQYVLPFGVVWGVQGLVCGPPSRPTTPIIEAAVGGLHNQDTIQFLWQHTGAQTPGTLYFSVPTGECGALTVPRAICGVVTRWQQQNGQWAKRA